MTSPSDDGLRPLQMIAGAMVVGSVALLAVALAVGTRDVDSFDPMAARSLAGMAAGWAVLSPLVAGLLTREAGKRSPPLPIHL